MPSTPTDDIAARAPALRPDDSGGEKLSGPAAIGAGMDRRIRDLENTIKHCDKMLSKQAKQEARRRRKTHKQLDEEEEKALVDRVYFREKQRRDDKLEQLQKERENPISAIPKISPSTIGSGLLSNYTEPSVVARLYDLSLEKKREQMEKHEKLLSEPVTESKKLDPAAVAEAGNRLCTKEVQDRAAKLNTLRQNYEMVGSRGGSRPGSPSKLQKEQQNAANERLCGNEQQKRKQKLESLRCKYSPEPEKKKLSKKAMEESAQRLSPTK